MKSVQINERVYTREFVYEKLSNDQKWIERALVRLLERQTNDEKNTNRTSHTNGRGFNQCDARWLTLLAKWVQSGHHLTPKQMQIVVKKDKRGIPRIAKYAGQILEIISERA